MCVTAGLWIKQTIQKRATQHFLKILNIIQMNMFINFPVVWFMFKYRNLHVNSKGTKMH